MITFILKFVLVTLGVFRIAFEMSAHLGPFDIFEKTRAWIQMIAIENPEKNLMFLDEFFRCATCLSLIISIPFVLLVFQDMSLANQLLVYFAVNGAVVIIHFRLLGE